MILLYTSLMLSLLTISSHNISSKPAKNNVKACLEAESKTPFESMTLEEGGCPPEPGSTCADIFIQEGDTWRLDGYEPSASFVIIAPIIE